jgi:tRNA-dihydrouridine synthase B
MIGKPLTIGGVQLETNLLLAPIAGHCDLSFRLTCREQGGVGIAFTDLLSPQGVLRGTARSLDIAQTNDDDKPLGMQLYGSDPGLMAEGAAWAAEHGTTIVDINMGCPVDKVVKKDGGSKLMCDPDRAQRIVAAVRDALPQAIPLTVKMRLGWDENAHERNVAGDLACRAIDAGAAAITVHGRTTEQRFRGACRRDGIARVVETVGEKTSGTVPVIGNGDVTQPQDAIAMMRETGCDGVMIGRGALATPWLFRDAWSLQVTGTVPTTPSDLEQIEIIRRFFDRMLGFKGERYAIHQITRRISWLGRNINDGHCKRLKEAVRVARTARNFHAALDGYTPEPRRTPEVETCV